MGPVEQWLLGNALEIVILVFGGIFAFLKLTSFQSSVVKKVEKTDDVLTAHLKSEIPHVSCQIETERIKSILDRLGRIEGGIDKLNELLVDFMRSGSSKERVKS